MEGVCNVLANRNCLKNGDFLDVTPCGSCLTLERKSWAESPLTLEYHIVLIRDIPWIKCYNLFHLLANY
jgi:hypothetical protein